MKKYLPFLFTAVLFAACKQDKPTNTVEPTIVHPTAKGGPFDQPEWAKSAILYEVNTRQFSPEGNFQGVTNQLARLTEMGVDVIWLMPIHPIGVKNRKGTLGSPYSVRDYKKINPDFGTEDDLTNLVKSAHEYGLKVILDWVPNHTAWDHVWVEQHPEYYTRIDGKFTVPLNEKGEPIADWSDIMDLDYNKPATRAAMIDAMQYWLKTFDIDGFRVDMAGLVPDDFWKEARPALDTIKPVFMLSEWQDEPLHFESAFNANYAWKWKDVTKDIGAGKQTAISLDTLKTYLDEFYPKGYYQLHFTQNHDENTWSGTENDLYGASADAFNVLAFTWAGIPMLYGGQESGLSQKLPFFEKEAIRWKNYPKSDFFNKLCALRHNNRALDAGKFGGAMQKIKTSADEKIYAFTREKNGDRVIVILNLSKTAQMVSIETDNSMVGAYTNLFGNNSIQVTKGMQLNLRPWEYIVWTNK